MAKGENGFTLIELLVTITFVGIIMMVMSSTMLSSIKVGKLADRRHQALNLATLMMEDLYNDDYDTLTGSFTYTLLDGFSGRVQVQDQELDDSGQSLLKKIIVTVTWSEGDQTKQVQLNTLRAKLLF